VNVLLCMGCPTQFALRSDFNGVDTRKIRGRVPHFSKDQFWNSSKKSARLLEVVTL